MMPRRAMLALAATAAATAAGLGAPAVRAQDDAGWQEAPTVAPVGSEDRLYGKPDARFSLIVWLDPECPYCKVLGEKPEHVVDQSKGQVNLVVRLYPLPFHGPNALVAATTALCVAEQAGPAGYYRFLNGWMARTGSNGKGLMAPDQGGNDPVAALAATAGARDSNALAGCSTSDKTGKRLAAEMKGAEVAGIEGTPAIALRDNRVGHAIMVSGAIEEVDMRNAIRVLGEFDDNPNGTDANGTGPHGSGSGGATH